MQLHHPAKAISIGKDMRDEISSIRIASLESSTETDIPCTRIVIAAGAWSPQVFATLFPTSSFKLPVSSLAGHSLVVKSPRWTQAYEHEGCHAVFTTDPGGYSPELFSRMGEEIYVAGLNSSTIPLPALPTDAKIEDEATEKLLVTAKRLLSIGKEDDLQVVRKGLCFRPVTSRGTPILGRIPDNKLGGKVSTRPGGEGGVFVAAGHGPWGISMSLGTGKVMAQLIQGQPTSVDIRQLDI